MFKRAAKDEPRSFLIRSRWAAVGAAVAVSVGAGGVVASYAATSTPSSFTPITPCRVMDTRSGAPVGPRNTPLTAGVDYAISVRGNNGSCVGIPPNATGITLNVTAVNATAGSFLTVWPTGEARPNASSLNWSARQAPTPNAVNAALATSGQVSFWTESGTVDLIADITGYYTEAQRLMSFVHTTTTGNITSNVTSLGISDPNAIIVVSQNFQGVYIPAVGVNYNPGLSSWTIFREDRAAMPVGEKFNVMVLAPMETRLVL
jgi:hypothetical protein